MVTVVPVLLGSVGILGDSENRWVAAIDMRAKLAYFAACHLHYNHDSVHLLVAVSQS